MKKRLYFKPEAEITVVSSADDILQSSTDLLDKILNIKDGISDRIEW